MAQMRQKGSWAILRASRRPLLGERFNPSMLATLREAKFLSQDGLARKMGVSKALIGKWEAALAEPNEEQVQSLADALDARPELFYVDRPRRLASMSDFYHRAFSRARRRDVKAIHARCSLLDLQVDRLLDLAPLPEDRIPDIDPDNHAGDTDKVAGMARTAMGVPPGPIENLVDLIEECGGIVIDRNLEIDDVDALCRWVPELPKLFFVNGARPADRIRLSLTHELGHTIMHFDKDVEPRLAEDQANAFGLSFLLPPRELRRDLNPFLSLADLAALKRKWRVSMQAIARQAWRIGAIDDRRYKSICVQVSRNGWRKTEPVEVPRETPKAFGRLLYAHIAEGYSRDDLSRLLFVTPAEVDAMLAESDAAAQGVQLRLAN